MRVKTNVAIYIIKIFASITDRNADSYAKKQFLQLTLQSITVFTTILHHSVTATHFNRQIKTHTGPYPFHWGEDGCICVPVDEGCVEHVGGAW